MRDLKIGDPVGLRDGVGWFGTVLDVVESRPRWLLVYWHSPPNVDINPLLESEQFLALTIEDEGRVEHGGARCMTIQGNDEPRGMSLRPSRGRPSGARGCACERRRPSNDEGEAVA